MTAGGLKTIIHPQKDKVHKYDKKEMLKIKF